MLEYIKNPVTGVQHLLQSQEGLRILRQYVKLCTGVGPSSRISAYQSGGFLFGPTMKNLGRKLVIYTHQSTDVQQYKVLLVKSKERQYRFQFSTPQSVQLIYNHVIITLKLRLQTLQGIMYEKIQVIIGILENKDTTKMDLVLRLDHIAKTDKLMELFTRLRDYF